MEKDEKQLDDEKNIHSQYHQINAIKDKMKVYSPR